MQRLEELVGVPVSVVSIGPAREQSLPVAMRVLVVGGGGREHALAWRLAQSPPVEELLRRARQRRDRGGGACVAVPADDIPGIAALVERERIDLTVVGPEAPLVAGLADELRRRAGTSSSARRAASARIEGSKAWAKELCVRHGIPDGARRRVHRRRSRRSRSSTSSAAAPS